MPDRLNISRRRWLSRLVVPVALLTIVLAESTQATAGEADYARVNASLARGHAIPRNRKLAQAAAAFDSSAAAFCRSPTPRDFKAVRAAFHAALDRWMAVEHIRHGPVELLMRNFRIYYWPDKRSRGARQMRQLLSRQDDAILAPDRFRSESVAVQGFPAAERLLFDADTAEALITGANGDYTCRLLAAIAANVAEMAAGMAANWTEGPSSFLNDLRHVGGTDARFASHKEATADFVKGMHTTLQLMTDMKLDRVLGKSIAAARPRLAESWRSERSLRNLDLNLEALLAMYEGEGGEGLRNLLGPSDEALAALLSKAFRQTLATARSIRIPLASAVSDPTMRPPVEQLAKEIRALKELVSGKLAPAIGTPLGFNALDGD